MQLIEESGSFSATPLFLMGAGGISAAEGEIPLGPPFKKGGS